ncbi:putative phosphatase [Desulfosporosinus orientis DSM 765]|uniref:Putative phosphatase n=1 Tax=Desulfosporosinus orientis (strain ATCC 19365 / DSM 765 / NCIMB 8382 / VKM B-1628 / Singapore I) TaxID=768706 RepID=G7WCR4_DESOD|nr:HAD hydrolase-like protein [Desulfosporosinus orientis]AET66820.1 putative phosphatase [Desulfosporosinus orientis DSM 765]
MRYYILLWDLDGTLTDSKEGITRSVQYALKKLGYSIPDANDLNWVIGPPLKESFRVMLKTSDEALLNQAVALYRERFRETGLYENIVYPGIPELLVQLKEQGCRNFLATSKPRVFAEKILQHFELKEHFEHIMGSELDGKLVDKESIISEVLKGLPQEARSKTVMIGDRKYDVQGARANRIDVIGVGYGYGTLEELHKAEADWIAPSVQALRDLLLR